MVMARDSKEHLRRMEEELLGGKFDDSAPLASVRNNDRLDIDLNDYSEDVYEQPPREKSVRGLLILAILESLGIAAIIVYWLVQLG